MRNVVCCSASWCALNEKDNPNIRFFRFPSEENKTLYDAWARYTGNERLLEGRSKQAWLCQLHFAPTAFRTDQVLIHNAIPSIPPSDITDDFGINVNQELSFSGGQAEGDNTSCKKMCMGSVIRRERSLSSYQFLQPVSAPNSKRNSTTYQKLRNHLLQNIGVCRFEELTPLEKCLFESVMNRTHEAMLMKKKLKNKLMKLNDISEEIISTPIIMARSIVSRMSSRAFNLLLQQIKCTSRKLTRNYQWSLNQKIVALAINNRFPKCYRLLSYMIPLPSRKSLSQILNSIPLYTGVDVNFLSLLAKTLSSFDKEDRMCALVFGEMSIRNHMKYVFMNDRILGFEDFGSSRRSEIMANNVLVFMLRGIQQMWTQPIGFYFSYGKTKLEILVTLLKEVLDACISVGINVVATVCDHGSNNSKVLSLIGCSKEYPLFTHKGKKIISLYDAPKLLISTRNAFRKYDVSVSGKMKGSEVKGVAKWSDLLDAYDIQHSHEVKLLYKVTAHHLNPDGPKSRIVRYAAQTLSFNMATLIASFTENGQLNKSAAATALFIYDVDKLFDSFNGCEEESRSNTGLRVILKVNRERLHLNYWKEAFSTVSNWTFMNRDNKSFRPACQDGWLWTINAMQLLWGKLKKAGCTSLKTRHLNQDVLRHLFSRIRSYNEMKLTPSLSQFISSLKICLLQNLEFPVTLNSDNEVQSTLLVDYRDFLSTMENYGQSIHHSLLGTLYNDNLWTHDFSFLLQDFKFKENLSLIYITGFITKKFLVKIKCRDCQSSIVSLAPLTGYNDSGIAFIENFEGYKGIIFPTLEMLKAAGLSITVIEGFLDRCSYLDGIKKTIITLIENEGYFNRIDECPLHSQSLRLNLISAITNVVVAWWCMKKNLLLNKELIKKRKKSTLARLSHLRIS